MLITEFHFSYFPHDVKPISLKSIKANVGNDKDSLIQICGKPTYVRA